jgi:hypothetical protein
MPRPEDYYNDINSSKEKYGGSYTRIEGTKRLPRYWPERMSGIIAVTLPQKETRGDIFI